MDALAAADTIQRTEQALPETQGNRTEEVLLTASQISHPGNAGKRKKRKKRQSQALLSAELSSSSISSQWSEELQRLRGDYHEDLTEDSQSVIRVFLFPKTQDKIYCSVELTVKVTGNYPSEPAVYALGKSVGIETEAERAMASSISDIGTDLARKGQESVRTICEHITAALSEINGREVRRRAEVSRSRIQVPEGGMVRKISGDLDGYMIVGRSHKKDATPFDKKPIKRPEANFTPFQSRFALEFRCASKIGEGGGGSVYRAVDIFDEKTYAIKVVKLKHRSPAKISKLTKEVALLSELYHEHIVRYYNTWTEEKVESEDSSKSGDDSSYEDSENSLSGSASSQSSSFSSSISEDSDQGSLINFESSSEGEAFSDASSESEKVTRKHSEGTQHVRLLYIKMEFCEGETLRAMLDSDAPLEPAERWRMFREILEALSYIHSRSLVHRDLKPANIFLDKSQSVKIGDFGLATTSKRKVKSSENSDDEGAKGSSASAGVGTLFYASPEQEVGKGVDEKSDMYSLGVIFYEMWRKFGSVMQRMEEFKKIAESQTLPKDFLATAPANVVAVIQQLIRKDPIERPKAREMLFSELLPHRFERQLLDELVRTVLNPMTSERKWVLDALFSRQSNPPDVDFSFSLTGRDKDASQDETRRLVKLHSLVQNSILNRFQGVFERAGAIHIPAPLINPYYDFLEISEQLPNGQSVLAPVKSEAMSRNKVVTYMENTGVIVALPSTALVPWSRMISRKNLGGIIKRYCFSPVFHPRERQEPEHDLLAVFDICCEERLPALVKTQMEAEVIKVTCDALQTMAGELPNFDVHVNSSKLMDGIFSWLDVQRSVRMEALQILCDFNRKKWLVVKAHLEKIGLAAEKAERLGLAMRQSGAIGTIRDYLRSKTGKSFTFFRSELQALEKLVECCECFGIKNVIIDLSVISDSLLCYSGLMFKVTGRNKVDPPQFAFGGRYDNLINHFEFPDKEQNMFDSRPVRMSGVGVWIEMNHIVSLVLKQHAETPKCLFGPRAVVVSCCQSEEDQWKMLLEKAAFCAELWKADIRANYLYEEVTPAVAESYSDRYRIQYLITLKLTAHSEEATAVYQDRFSQRASERDMNKTELVRSLIYEMRTQTSQAN